MKNKMIFKSFILAFFSIGLANNLYSQKLDTLSVICDILTSTDYFIEHKISSFYFPYDTIYYEYDNIEKDTFLDIEYYTHTLQLDTISKRNYAKGNCEKEIYSSSNKSDLLLLIDTILIDTTKHIFQITKEAPNRYLEYNSFLSPEYKHLEADRFLDFRGFIPIKYIIIYNIDSGEYKYTSLLINSVKPIFCLTSTYITGVINIRGDYKIIDQHNDFIFYEYIDKFRPDFDISKILIFNSDTIVSRFNSATGMWKRHYSNLPFMPDTIYVNSPFHYMDTTIELGEVFDVTIMGDSIDFSYGYTITNKEAKYYWGFESDELIECHTINTNCVVKYLSDYSLHKKLLDESLIVDKQYKDYYFLELDSYRQSLYKPEEKYYSPNIIRYKKHYTIPPR